MSNISKEQLIGRAVIAGGLALGALAGHNSSARAIGEDCQDTRVKVIASGFADNPLEIAGNRPNILDLYDIVVGSPQMGRVIFRYTENALDPNAVWRDIRGDHMINNGGYSEQTFNFDDLRLKSNYTNRNGQPALAFKAYFEDDKKKPEGTLTPTSTSTPIATSTPSNRGLVETPTPTAGPNRGQVEIPIEVTCGFTRVAWGGRPAPESEIQKLINSDHRFMTFSSIYDQAVRKDTGKASAVTVQSVDQKEIRRALEEYYKKQKQTPTPAAGGTETPTPTGTRPAGTPTGTKTAETPTATVTGTRTAETPTPTGTRPAGTPTRTATVTATRTATSTEVVPSPTQVVVPSPEPTPETNPTPALGDGLNLPDFAQIQEIIGQSPVGTLFDLPAKGLDQITENDVEQPVRTGIDIAGWLLALGLLFNRPGHPRTRVLNTVAWPVRYPLYRIALTRHNAQAAAGVVPLGPAPTAPVRPLGV